MASLSTQYLPPQQQQLWDVYLESERVRVRHSSLDHLQNFIQSLVPLSVDQWHPWALDIARQVERGDDIPVRMALFRLVLFPALREALLSGAAAPARMLAGLITYLHHCPDCQALLPERMQSRSGLLQEAVRRNPKDEKARNELLHIFHGRFEYALHELPTGVLYGADGATIDQCTEMLEELSEYQELANRTKNETEHTKMITEAFFHVNTYRNYLAHEDMYVNYESYLSQGNA